MGLFLILNVFLVYKSLPDPLFKTPYSTVLLARDGSLLDAKIARDGQWRFPPTECPRRFGIAAMAFEDGRFHWHPGIDPVAVILAMRKNLGAGKVVSGASTITMQVIRLSRPGQPRSYLEKIIESALALRLEMSFSKSEILSLYASHAPFGGNVVGVTAASWRYYGRGPESLSWAEASLLAVLPNSPSLMHPGRNRDRLQSKRNVLLERLWHRGRIDSLTCALAKMEPLPEKPLALPHEAPHLVQRLSPLPSRVSVASVVSIWHSTLDATLQANINGILRRHRPGLEGAGIQNAAVLVLDTRTGATLAYVGNMPASTNNEAGRDVDIISSRRSTGSLLKPFLFAAMLETSEILPTTLVPDVPFQIAGYTPENFDRGFEGTVPAKKALARSLNVPAVRMLKDFGIDRFLHVLQKLGLSTLDRSASDYGLTLVLGGAEGNLWELTGLYAGLAREAQRYADPSPDADTRQTFFPPHFLSSDVDKNIAQSNKSADGNPSSSNPEIGPAAAWFTLQAMAEVSRPDAEHYWRSFVSSRWVAWKTGTSFGFRDAWAVGVTPEFVVGVWVGNANGQGRPGMTGIQVAAPILFEAFNLLPATTGFSMPMASMAKITVCRQSGMRPSPYCPHIDSQWIPTAGIRTPACHYHRIVHLDPSKQVQVHDGCESVSKMRHLPWFVLPPTQEWYYRQRHSDYTPLPPLRSDCASEAWTLARPRSMELIYPRGTAKIYVPIDLGARKSRTVFEAVHRDATATIFWHLDQEYLGQSHEFHKWALDPPPGNHTLLLVDNKGERLEHTFEVLTRDEKTGAR